MPPELKSRMQVRGGSQGGAGEKVNVESRSSHALTHTHAHTRTFTHTSLFPPMDAPQEPQAQAALLSALSPRACLHLLGVAYAKSAAKRWQARCKGETVIPQHLQVVGVVGTGGRGASRR